MIFDAAAFWKILAVFIFVVLALIAVSLILDSYVRFMYYQHDRETRIAENAAKIIVDGVKDKPYTGNCQEDSETERA